MGHNMHFHGQDVDYAALGAKSRGGKQAGVKCPICQDGKRYGNLPNHIRSAHPDGVRLLTGDD